MCSYVPLDKVGILTSLSAFSSAHLIKDRAFFAYKINLSWLIVIANKWVF